MNTNAPARLVLPAVLLIGLLLFSLSGFIGSVYHPFIFNSEKSSSTEVLELSAKYPQSIQQWKAVIEENAEEHRVDPNLIAAVMLEESGGNPQALSVSGAIGLMQVMPRDGIAASFICGSRPCFSNRPSMAELYDPAFNISYGTRMLSSLTRKEGSIRQALYRYGPIDVGLDYADAVLSIYRNYQ